MPAPEELIAIAMAGLVDDDVADYVAACLRVLGPTPALAEIAGVVGPFATEFEWPAERATALCSALVVALRETEQMPEPEPELEPGQRVGTAPFEYNDGPTLPAAMQSPLRPQQHSAIQQHQHGHDQSQQRQRQQQRRRQRQDHHQQQQQQQQQHAQRNPVSVGESGRAFTPQWAAHQRRAQMSGREVAEQGTAQAQRTAPVGIEPIKNDLTANKMADEAADLLANSSLSQQQRSTWIKLCGALAAATPSPQQAKRGKPEASVLDAMRHARQARDDFIDGALQPLLVASSSKHRH